MFVSQALAIKDPGANKSTRGPQLLELSFLSAPGAAVEDEIAPTHMTFEAEPGDDPRL